MDERFFSKRLNSVASIAKAYSFFAFKKGRDYVYKLPPQINYRPHWLREAAQPDKEGDAQCRVVGRLPEWFFPWGQLLTTLMAREDERFRLVPEEAAECLERLRALTIRHQPPRMLGQRDAARQLEAFATEALHEATGWIPPKRPSRRAWAAAWQHGREMVRVFVKKLLQQTLGEVAGPMGRSVPDVVEAVSYVIGPDLVRSAEFSGRRLYHRLSPRSQALEPYTSAPVRKAIRQYARRARSET